MYKIVCDNHDIFDTQNPFIGLISAVLELELNSSGLLTFTIAPNHYFYNNIKKRKSVIKVYQDNDLIFFGSPIDDSTDDNLIKTITVEGALSWLGDTIQPYGMYNDIDVEEFLQSIITIHNNQVSEFKQFTLGNVTVTDSNGNLYRYTNYEKTKDVISSDLISSLGGYIKARHSNGVNYIDYTVNSGDINTQGVRFGFNLINIIKELKSNATATAIIPLGAKISEDSDERLTIASVNDGAIYVYDTDSVEEFDWIYDTVIFDNVTVAENLKSKGLSELAKRKYLSGSYTVNAIDMSLLDGNYESIRIGDSIPIVSQKHGIDDYMTVSAMSVDICDPTQSTLTIGSNYTTLTDSKNHADKVIDLIISDYVKNEQIIDVKNSISTVETNVSEITQKANGIQLAVLNLEETTGNLGGEFQLQKSLIEHNADQIVLSFLKIINNEQTIAGNKAELEQYIRFAGNTIELGETDSPFKSLFSNVKLSFLQNNVEIAYISNNKLYITNVEILNKLRIGTPTTGYYTQQVVNGYLVEGYES